MKIITPETFSADSKSLYFHVLYVWASRLVYQKKVCTEIVRLEWHICKASEFAKFFCLSEFDLLNTIYIIC